MVWFPFLCLAAGGVVGCSPIAGRVSKWMDPLLNGGVILLMLILGASIGSRETLLENLGLLGWQCLIIALMAIGGSVCCTVILERTILPLRDLQRLQKQAAIEEGATPPDITQQEESTGVSLLWIMPGSVVAGVSLGSQLSEGWRPVLEYGLTASLVLLYIGVGISFGINRGVFRYLKMVSWRVMLLPGAVIVGSLLGGGLAGLLLHMPLSVTVGAAAGMSYYSITGAMLTQAYGIEVGAYGFLVNVAREFLTVLLLPVLIRVSWGSPIAAGAAGNMDTMLVPITRFVGAELGVVTLITGAVLTFIVPFLLSLCIGIA